MKKVIFALLFAFLISCVQTTTPGPSINLSEYYQTPNDTLKAEILPPRYVLEKKKPRVVVLKMGDYSRRRCNLGSLATDLMHNIVAKTGTFEVVERARANQLARELGYQEEHGVDWEKIEKRYFSLGKDIDYAIVGVVNDVSVSQSQKAGYYTSVGTYVPPECRVDAEVTFTFRVIDFSTGRVVKSFTVKGKETDIARTGCHFTCGLAQKALSKAINRYVPVYLREAIPVYGYIRKIMTRKVGDEITKIAYISLGRLDGIQPGEKIEIIERRVEIDPVSGRKIDRYIPLGEGVVAQEGLTDDESIIVISDVALMKRIRVGHMVRLTAAAAKERAQEEEAKDVLKKFWKSITR